MKKYIRSSYPDPDKVASAQKFLDSQDQAKVDFVDDCFGDFMDTYVSSDPDMIFHNADRIMKRYQREAIEEWGDLSTEEAGRLFDKIYKAIEIVNAEEADSWI